MSDVDDIEVRQAMSSVHGPRLPWVLLAFSVAFGAAGIVHLRRQLHQGHQELSASDTRAAQAQARLVALQASRTDLESRIGVLERDRSELTEIRSKRAAEAKAAEELAARHQAVSQALAVKLKRELEAGEALVTLSAGQLAIELGEAVLFDPEAAAISKRGEQVLSAIGSVIAPLKDHRVDLVAHAGSPKVPDKLKAQLPTAWELTAQRAASVARHLAEKTKVDSKQLSAIGAAATRPAREESKAARIEIVLSPPAPSPEAMADAQGLSTAK